MKKWKLPPRTKLDSPQNYFSTFLKVNRDAQGFSQRNVARKLKWPVSYLPDLMRGRKKFTIQRALEFAEYFEVEPITRDKLIFMAVGDQLPAYRSATDTPPTGSVKSLLAETRRDDLLDGRLLMVWKTLWWTREEVTAEFLANKLDRYSFSPLEVARKLLVLVAEGVVTSTANGFTALHDIEESDDHYHPALDDEKFHTQMAGFFQTYMRNRIRPGAYFATFLELDVRKFDEYAGKLAELQNWLLEESFQAHRQSKGETLVFQVDLNLTPLFEV